MPEAAEPWVANTVDEAGDKAAVTAALSVAYDAVERVQSVANSRPHLQGTTKTAVDRLLGEALDAIDDAEQAIRRGELASARVWIDPVRIVPGVGTAYRVLVDGADAWTGDDEDEARDVRDQYIEELRDFGRSA